MFTNVHTHIGIRKTRNWFRYEIGSGTKLLFTFNFLSLRFFHMRRERHNFFNKRVAHFVDPNWSHLNETKNRLPSSRLDSQLTLFFKSQNPQLAASGYDVIHVTGHTFSLVFFFFVTCLIVTSAPHAGEHLHSMCAPN